MSISEIYNTLSTLIRNRSQLSDEDRSQLAHIHRLVDTGPGEPSASDVQWMQDMLAKIQE